MARLRIDWYAQHSSNKKSLALGMHKSLFS